MKTARDKVMGLKEAVGRYVTDGCHLSIGGFTVVRNPMAAVYEIMRKGTKGIHLYAHSNGQGMDELVGAGCVSRLDIAYGGSGRFAPTCPRFRKAVEEGSIEVEDYTNFQMTLRFLAGAMGLPFLPTRSSLGTSIIDTWGFSLSQRKQDHTLPDSKHVTMDNPFGTWGDAAKVVLVPAVNPDVTIIHAQRADRQGTARIEGLTFADVEQAKAAKRLIVTCEELVDVEQLRGDPDRNQIPFFHVDAVVHVPYGAYPTACWSCYDYDPVHLNAYAKSAQDDRSFKDYLGRYVYGVKDHQGLLDLAGKQRLEELKADPGAGYAPGLDRRFNTTRPGGGDMPGYSSREIMAIVAARQIRDNEIVFCGTGISMLAAMAAKRISAPQSVIVFETGAIDSGLAQIPLTVADLRVMSGTCVNAGLADAFSLIQNQVTGRGVVGILGAAQIDRYGNLNSTSLGDYARPDRRFPGSGGACDVASLVGRTIIFMQQEKRRFVPALDYLTSPGWLDGPGGREKAGLPPGGPSAVITNMAIMRFDDRTREMYLAGCYPGIAPADVLDNMGFDIDVSRAEQVEPPSPQELEILRDQCDPQRLILEHRSNGSRPF